jgi:uncharacterized protein (TIGR03085 family)
LDSTERDLLCTLAERLGPDAPTLCEGWDARDLVVHLLVREGSPAAVGIVVPPLSGLVRHASDRKARTAFPKLVRELRSGPPLWSLFRLPRLGGILNSVEFFVHHEDLRRAQAGWEPRTLSAGTERLMWRSVSVTGRGMVRKARIGVVAERSDTGERVTLRSGDRDVVLRGMPSELVLYLHGRTGHARVELLGDPDDIAELEATPLGV